MQLNWDDIRYFLALCRTRSFLAAGAELKVTHSTVSRRLTALETALGTQLVSRTEKGCRLTQAGEKLLPYAEQLESTVIHLVGDVSGRDNQLSGSVRIGAPDGLGTSFLAARLGKFQQRHPALVLELLAVPMYYSLAKREIDILITVRKPTAGNIIVRKLTNYRLGLFATKNYLARRAPILRREDLKVHRAIGYIVELLYDQDLSFINELPIGQGTKFRSSTVIGQKQAILADNGIGVLPYFLADGEPTLMAVLPEMHAERTFWLQVNPESRKIARVRVTMDYILDEVLAQAGLFLNLPKADQTEALSSKR